MRPWNLKITVSTCIRLVDEIVWVKMTVNKRLAKSHGYYLQHAKEVCLVGKRGHAISAIRKSIGSDVIYSERRGQSQKPEEIYHLIEDLFPGGELANLETRISKKDYFLWEINDLQYIIYCQSHKLKRRDLHFNAANFKQGITWRSLDGRIT